jgi:DNA repair exonuclease SbcCD ATPase subunit
VINFSVVRYKNFLSTGNLFTEIKLNENATTLIVGENGAGKSSFLDAITFALFGKPFRNINKPQLVNSINEKDCLVEVEFDIGKKSYKIVRGIKPNIFEIYCDGDLLNQDAKAKDYQDHLEKIILKMNYKSFTQIVILGSTNFTPFMQLSAADRRTVIEDLLDIQIFSSMNVIVKSKLHTLKDEAAQLKIQIDNTRDKIELHKKHLDELKKNTKEIVDAKKQEVNENTASLSALEIEATDKETQIENLLTEVSDDDSTSKKFTKLNQLEAKIEGNIQKLEKDIEFYSVNSTCPTCDQAINNKEEKVHTCNSKITELTEGLTKLKEESDAVLRRINTIKATQKELKILEQDLVRINTSRKQVRNYITKLEKEISEIENKPAMSDEFKAQSKELLNALQTFNEKRKTVSEQTQNYDIVAQLLKDGGIKSKIIKQYVPVINKLVNKYLAAMDFFVNFNIDEEFKETIKSRHRDDFSYENFSEGEKARLNLAILFAWRSIARLKNSVSCNLLILDEVFDGSLDASGTECLLKVFGSLSLDTNLFVISHKTEQMVDKFKHTIRFAKVKNFSQVVA